VTDSSQEEAQGLRSYPQGDLESPFSQEELFAGEPEVVWETRVAALETETPFARDLMQGAGPAVQSEYEEKVETSREVEAPYAYEELEEHEEEDGGKFDRDVKDTPEELEAAREDEEPEGAEEEFEAFEDEGPEEALAVPYEPESSIVLSHEDAVQQALEEPLPQLFDAERPEPEEEVDEEAELPRDPADGWVVPEDVRRAGEAQTIAYDDAPPWDESRRNCAGRLSEGARVLRGYLLDNFPGIREIGGYNCRQNSASPSKLSVHGTGRALDIMIPTVGGRANSTVGDPIANWLVVNASAIGVQYLIWNRVRWSGGRGKEKFARYTGPNPHRDHIHVELTLDGAQRSTPWFAGRAVPAGVAPGETIDYDKAMRLNRLYGNQLGWQYRVNELTRLLGLRSYAPEERSFVDAVARWQRQQGLGVDGILGPRAWERMQSALRVASVGTSPSVTQVVFSSGLTLPVVAGLPEGKDQEYWDPTNSGNPLLDTGPAYKDKKLSEKFAVRELTTSGGVSADIARIDPKLVECLQKLRDHVGQAVTITSGYRSWKRNKEVYAGKRPTRSQHCAGRAADIRIPGMNGLRIGRAAIDACGPNIGVGLGNTFAHIDVRGIAAAWNYGGADDSWVAEIKRYQQAKDGR
jgi:uncharacterized protein YcbK (DUF882 family)